MRSRSSLIGCLAVLLAASGCGSDDGAATKAGSTAGDASFGAPLRMKPSCGPRQRRQVVYGQGLERGLAFFAARAAGSARVELTHGGNFGLGLAISPDGCRVAYISAGDLRPNNTVPQARLLITNADGSGDLQSALVGISSQSEIAWSPDGSQIAIVNSDGLSIFDPASGKLRKIGLGDIYDSHSPSWSPDGRQIAFAGATPDDVGPDSLIMPDVYLVDVRGGEGPRRVLETPKFAEYEVAWSPDGKWIASIDNSASTEDTTGPQDQFRRGVFLVSPDGNRRRRLTPTTGIQPSWLPDSSAVVYARNECHGGPPAKFGPCSGETAVAVPLDGGPDRRLFRARAGYSLPGLEYARDAGMP